MSSSLKSILNTASNSFDFDGRFFSIPLIEE
jgi:[ribosomal protein S5]-alanine N-acetyltransferase